MLNVTEADAMDPRMAVQLTVQETSLSLRQVYFFMIPYSVILLSLLYRFVQEVRKQRKDKKGTSPIEVVCPGLDLDGKFGLASLLTQQSGQASHSRSHAPAFIERLQQIFKPSTCQKSSSSSGPVPVLQQDVRMPEQLKGLRLRQRNRNKISSHKDRELTLSTSSPKLEMQVPKTPEKAGSAESGGSLEGRDAWQVEETSSVEALRMEATAPKVLPFQKQHDPLPAFAIPHLEHVPPTEPPFLPFQRKPQDVESPASRPAPTAVPPQKLQALQAAAEGVARSGSSLRTCLASFRDPRRLATCPDTEALHPLAPLPSPCQEPEMSLAVLHKLMTNSVAQGGQDGDFFQLSWDPAGLQSQRRVRNFHPAHEALDGTLPPVPAPPPFGPPPGLEAPEEDTENLRPRLMRHITEALKKSHIPSELSDNPLVIPSIGSFGHPDMCYRPCVYLAKGCCKREVFCTHCHFDHEKTFRLGKNQKKYLENQLGEVSVLAALLPHIHTKAVERGLQREVIPLCALIHQRVQDLGKITLIRLVPPELARALGRLSLHTLLGILIRRTDFVPDFMDDLTVAVAQFRAAIPTSLRSIDVDPEGGMIVAAPMALMS
mmetsp:Transcript_16882/g.35535  ORF Transcript_16882/g.35535 Transcript_16882/m.35535 type:complete len:602 (-) Transcript_16882:103-1908(-)